MPNATCGVPLRLILTRERINTTQIVGDPRRARAKSLRPGYDLRVERDLVWPGGANADRRANGSGGRNLRMLKLTAIETSRQAVWAARRKGQKSGLVPTMGALHEGHYSLIREARARCDFVAVSVFVNPAQFGPNEDFTAYPRTEAADLEACESLGVDLVFVPAVESIFPPNTLTNVVVSGLTERLCGLRRPGHFTGVATVVAKLFHILPTDLAFFGEKDYQQLQVVKRMVRDLDIPIDIIACPTIREPDGLAMSSRNALLSTDERQRAASLSHALFRIRDRVLAGERDVATLTAAIRAEIEAAGPFDIDYVEIVDDEHLEPLAAIDRSARICLAARIGTVHLIDNIGVDVPPAG